MDNSKKNVHNSGPLGMLVKTGQIKKVHLEEEPDHGKLQHVGLEGLKSAGSFFKTQAGIKFNENELVFVDPKECESWEYANRSDSEMGDIDELVKSIRENSQLQPALIRSHPHPHDGVKYQIIFGRRRHAACLILNTPLLVIKKDSLSLQEAIVCQDAENKFRKDVSNYSNAILYKKLLEHKAFKTEKELAAKLRIAPSSLNELMTYTKLPEEVVERIYNIHQLPVYMATKISRLLAENNHLLDELIRISPEIGKSITTPAKLEMALLSEKKHLADVSHRTKPIHDRNGKKIFTFKIDHKSVPSIVFQKNLLDQIDFDQVCAKIKDYIDSLNIQSMN